MKKLISLCLAFVFTFQFVISQEIAEWRGPDRTGVYNETGLLKEWPTNGPELLWSVDSLPPGYSSVSVANNLVYFTGMKDSMDVVIAVDIDGKLKWQTSYGRAWDNSFNHSRCTPTVENNRLYVSSGLGDVSCLNAINGELIWTVKASNKFEGTYGRWGIAESILLVDDKVFYTPGGNLTTMVAFNKETGELIWKSESLKDKPSYTSPMITEWAGKSMIINATESYLFGVTPDSGNILWKFNIGVFAAGEWHANNQTNTPLFYKGKIFHTSGYDHRCVMVELLEEEDKPYFSWVSDKLDVHHGGVVRLGDYIYGSNWENNRMGRWVCLDWNTGEVKYETEWENKGSIISADSMLYCYEEKNGNIALVKASPEKFEVTSSFKVPLGEGPHWSHLVIHKGILYVRHGGALMAYSIANKNL